MMKRAICGLGLVLAVAAMLWSGGLGPYAAEANPLIGRPEVLPRSWNLDFSHESLRPIAVEFDGETRWFWYMTYKVTNRTDREQVFVPYIEMATNTGQVVRANHEVPPQVFDAIKLRVDNPLLESPAAVVGRILQGDEYARESVAIWPATHPEVSTVRVFVRGLSGETATVRHPVVRERPDGRRDVTFEDVLTIRTLMLTYDLPGRPDTPQFQPVVAEGSRWVMRAVREPAAEE